MSKKVKKSKIIGMMAGDPTATISVISDSKKHEKAQEKEQEAQLQASFNASMAAITTQDQVDAAAVEAAKLEQEKLRKRKGYKSTILTGSSGLTTPAPTLKTTLG